ncbi:hypothetical protein Ahy_A02g005511 isoform B [Arachis hypogaea]|uniref:Uncharacterized protein n=1 Tax=Arachis hypogaea TaxID=3818 RepID=A0A445E701_ARAHY|nr:hypothetical protein Ahy_A02g005511 isoform B [Arachis hypogaea]
MILNSSCCLIKLSKNMVSDRRELFLSLAGLMNSKRFWMVAMKEG